MRDAEGFLAWLVDLKQDLSIPAGLAAAGVPAAARARLPDLALADGCHQNNPRTCTRVDFARIFAEAT